MIRQTRLLAYMLTSLVILGCQTNPIKISGETLIKTFYCEYMTEIAGSTIIEAGNSIKQKYCTKELLNTINKQFSEGELDYDPFLKAQDANIENIASISVERDSKIPNEYSVSYIDNYSKKKINISLLLNDSLKIKSVW